MIRQKRAKYTLLTQPDTLCETYRTIEMEYGAQAAKHNVNGKTVNAKTLPTGVDIKTSNNLCLDV